MSVRWHYWIVYFALIIGIPLGVARLLGQGHGTMLVWLGLLWIMVQIPSMLGLPYPDLPGTRPDSAALLVFFGAISVLTGFVYHFMHQIVIAGAVFVFAAFLVSPLDVIWHRREMQKRQSVRKELA